jgi:hypothetical protein
LYDDVGLLTVYRRHNPALCKSTDRYYKRCTCPAWVEGTVGGKYVRLSLKTHSWERAVAKMRKMDATEDPTPPPAKKDEPVTIERAVNEYLADAEARELGEATLYKLNIISGNSSWRGPKPKATSSFVNSIYAQSRHTAPHGRMELSLRKRSKNASPASSGSAFVLDGSLRILRMAWAASL